MFSRGGTNHLRKVVIMLQKMQKQVTEEGDKSSKMFENFMCYCKSGVGDLEKSIASAQEKIPSLTSSIKESESQQQQLEKDIEAHKADRKGAEDAMAEATALRQKEKSAYDSDLSENKVDLKAVHKAVAALRAGSGQSFLQTPDAGRLRGYLNSESDALDSDRETLFSFLAGSQSGAYSPATGEVAGILDQMGDEMAQAQKEMVEQETSAVNEYYDLMTAKRKEVKVLGKAIEDKLGRVSVVGVEIATMKTEFEDTSEALTQDSAFLSDLNKNCGVKQELHAKAKDMRAQEILALAETIKVLNDDDALDLFKKTLPSAGASFLQVQATLAHTRVRHPHNANRARMDFIELALHGKTQGFEEVSTLIDKLVGTMKTEQKQDDEKKSYCLKEIDASEAKNKDLERNIGDTSAVIDEAKETMAGLEEEIKSLKVGIVELDDSVKKATENRKKENDEFQEMTASHSASKELLLFAKNRLNQFYNPAFHKAAPKQEQPGGIANSGINAASFVQLAAHAAPPPPPETAEAYTMKSAESGGVIQMMDLLVQDLEKELVTAKVEEKNAQETYERTMGDSASKRAEDSKALANKEAARADLAANLETKGALKNSLNKELKSVNEYIASVHSECDWLVKNYAVRQEARTDEVDSLDKAKAVLSGADYSFLQLGSPRKYRNILRRG